MGLGGERMGGGGTQHKLLFDLYLRVDYRRQGNMELGPFEVGKHNQKENTKCLSSCPDRLFARLFLSHIYFQKCKKNSSDTPDANFWR